MVKESIIKLDKFDLHRFFPLICHRVEWIVFDEADKLFESQFIEQADEILAACSHVDRKVGMFSATMLPAVEELARSVQKDPIKIQIGVQYTFQ